jgi:membrane protease YdiL (CAAX protease family)
MTNKEANPFIPIVVTIVAVICWAIFMLLYVLLWSPDFDWFQNLVIILLSLVVVGGFIALMWVVWAFRRGVAPSVPT